MEENYLFYSIYKNQIKDIVTLITEIFISVLKLETEQIKSLVFSSDKRELTMMTILTLKHLFKEERAKEVLDNTRSLKDTYKANITSLEKIIMLLAPLKEEKIRLYYNLIKTINNNEKEFDATNISSNENNKKMVYQGSIDQQSMKNENHSTHCSLTSNNIFVDINEQQIEDRRPLQYYKNPSNKGSYSSFKQEKLQTDKYEFIAHSECSRKSNSKGKNMSINGDTCLQNEIDNYNYLKMFETTKYPSNYLNYVPSTAMYSNNISTNLYSSNNSNNCFKDNFSTNSTINEKAFNSWGYSNRKPNYQNTNNNNKQPGYDIDIPEPLHYKDIFNSKN